MQGNTTWLGAALAAAFVILASATSCNMPSRNRAALSARSNGNATFRNDGATANGTASATPQDRSLLLFGEGAPARDAAFEAKAAANLQQHTPLADGADFDPTVDPAGGRIVFASTRHSKFSRLYSKQVDGATITQITDEQANDAQPAVSPDGKSVAFSSDRAGHWDIWIIDIDGRNPRQITGSPMPELHPSWSPDGKRLVYCRVHPREGRGELWISETENPGVKRLLGEGLFPAWSPTGDQIAFQRARSRGSRWFSIWTIQLEDNEALYPTEVASSNEAALIAPCWSPDGNQIAFTWVEGGEAEPDQDGVPTGRGIRADVGIVDVDGRGLQRLTRGAGENYSPHWAGDGRIYFSSRRGGGETIWSLRPYRPPISDPASALSRTRQSAQALETSAP